MQPRTSLLERIQSTASYAMSATWQGAKQTVSFIWRNKGKIAVVGIGVYIARNYPAGLSSPEKPFVTEGDGRLPGTDVLIHNRLREAKLTPRVIDLPFENEPIISPEYDGLSFDYDRHVSFAEKEARGVVCDLSGIYKGWVERTPDAPALDSPTVGGSHRMYLLSNKPQRPLELDEQASLLYVGEPAGNITIKAIKRSDSDPITPRASCSPMRSMR